MPTLANTIATNHIPSILLALKTLVRPCPEKVLEHLRRPQRTYDFDFLDALATLCAFAGPCESVSSAIDYSKGSNNLYIATSSSPPQTLQRQLLTWTDHMKRIPVTEEDPEYDSNGEQYTASEESFIIQVYSACHAKLLDVIDCDNVGQSVLGFLEMMPETDFLRRAIPIPQVIEDLKCLITLSSKKTLALDEDLLGLHRAATAVAEFERQISKSEWFSFFRALCSITNATDDLLEFATCKENKAQLQLPWNVTWVEVPRAASPFVATTNLRELGIRGGNTALCDLTASVEWNPFAPAPSENVRQVEESLNWFAGDGVVHCASALLYYLHTHRLSQDVEGFIGCSHPVCFACLELVQAYNSEFCTFFDVGDRAHLSEIDISWACPPTMDQAVRKKLEWGMLMDLSKLCTERHELNFVHIVTEPSYIQE